MWRILVPFLMGRSPRLCKSSKVNDSEMACILFSSRWNCVHFTGKNWNPTVSVFPPGDFVESVNSLPPVDFWANLSRMCSSLATLTWRTLTTRRTFSCCKRRAIYDLIRPSLAGEEVDRAIRDRIPEKTRPSTQWAVSVFRAWQVCGVKEKVEVLSVKKLSELLLVY